MPVSDVLTYPAEIAHGKLCIQNKRMFNWEISQLRHGSQVEVAIRLKRATRSLAANRYYWGVVLKLIADETGYTVDEVHDLMKQLKLPKRLAICDGNGEIKGEYVLGGSTRGLTITEFSEYVRDVKLWAAETLGLEIPDADA